MRSSIHCHLLTADQQLSGTIRYTEALAIFEHTLAMDDAFVPAWDGKAWALGILGKRDEALAAVNRALELDPEYFDAIKRKKRLETL